MNEIETPVLKGAELLAKLQALDGMPTSEQAKACGYIASTNSGKPRVNFTAFYKACAEARGQTFAAGAKLVGRELAYAGKAGTSGQCMIGSRYAEMVGIQPGDRFEIEVDKEDNCIIVSKAAAEATAAPQAVTTPVAA